MTLALADRIRLLCKALSRESYPLEADYFDMAWTAYENAYISPADGDSQLSRLSDSFQNSNRVTVLPEGAGEASATLHLIATIAELSLILENEALQGALTEEQVCRQIDIVCIRRGTPEHVRVLLETTLPKFFCAFFGTSQRPPPNVANSPSRAQISNHKNAGVIDQMLSAKGLSVSQWKAEDSPVYIEGVLGSNYFPPKAYPHAMMRELDIQSEFDIVVNELSRQIDCRGRSSISFASVDSGGLAVTWLVFVCRSACADMKYRDIESLFGIPHAVAFRSRTDRIHQYTSAARRVFESPRRGILGRAKNRQYFIARSGWTFSWIRGAETRIDSNLLDASQKFLAPAVLAELGFRPAEICP